MKQDLYRTLARAVSASYAFVLWSGRQPIWVVQRFLADGYRFGSSKSPSVKSPDTTESGRSSENSKGAAFNDGDPLDQGSFALFLSAFLSVF